MVWTYQRDWYLGIEEMFSVAHYLYRYIMDPEEFRTRGKQMIDYVADYLENIRSRRPYPEVQPGYIKELLPDHAPEKPDKWEDVFTDIERVIMPGVRYEIYCRSNSELTILTYRGNGV
jgi:hypothetical protein